MERNSRLGPYEIAEQLGAGGMGEVYLAQDTRLGRKVAVKVLPAEFAADPERLARFEQEARAAAALNHPNIAAVHDVGASEGTHFIVQEYLEGHSLGSLLRAEQPRLDRALEIGAAVADALAVAHAAGIVHRDIKPDNIFVTSAGHTKVLDFGLAKLLEMPSVGSGTDPAASPTAIGTMAGVVMGTVGYMAPEQVEAGEIDGRTDVFSLGCVLYELVTGTQPFAGQSVPDSLSHILHREPTPLSEAGVAAPAELQRIVSKCVQKRPERRYQSAADLAVDLRALAAAPEPAAAGARVAQSEPSPRPSGVPRMVAAVGAVALVAITALTSHLLGGSAGSPASVSRFDLVHPGGFDRRNSESAMLTISRDGSSVAYVVTQGQSGVWVRNLGDMTPSAVYPAETFPGYPVFSPDGQRVGFSDLTGFGVLPATGGARIDEITVEEGGLVSGVRGIDWANNGVIYLARGPGGIIADRLDGTDVEVVVEVDGGEVAAAPELLPGGEWLMFSLRRTGQTWSEADVVAQHLGSGERRTLVSGGVGARYSASGHLLYAHEHDVFAAPFDPGTLEVGNGVRVLENIAMVTRADVGGAQYAISDTGTLVYLDREAPLLLVPRWVDRTGGSRETIGAAVDQATSISLSPDGTRYLVTANTQLFVERSGTGVRQVLPTGEFPSADSPAVWTRDGTEIVYEARDGHLYRIPADGSGRPQPVGTPAGHRHPMAWTADGDLLFTEIDEQSIYAIGLEDAEPQPVLVRDFQDGLLGVATSPDGRWMAYTSSDGGGGRVEGEVWIQELPGGPRVQVSSTGGAFPVWAQDGRELYFISNVDGVQTMMAVSFAGGDASRPLPPQPLFAAPDLLVGGLYGGFDVAADGRFLALEKPYDLPPERHIRVVLNWFEELNALVPPIR
jgi:serine/threonine protein kinase